MEISETAKKSVPFHCQAWLTLSPHSDFIAWSYALCRFIHMPADTPSIISSPCAILSVIAFCSEMMPSRASGGVGFIPTLATADENYNDNVSMAVGCGQEL